jgi:hypothetical protein
MIPDGRSCRCRWARTSMMHFRSEQPWICLARIRFTSQYLRMKSSSHLGLFPASGCLTTKESCLLGGSSITSPSAKGQPTQGSPLQTPHNPLYLALQSQPRSVHLPPAQHRRSECQLARPLPLAAHRFLGPELLRGPQHRAHPQLQLSVNRHLEPSPLLPLLVSPPPLVWG